MFSQAVQLNCHCMSGARVGWGGNPPSPLWAPSFPLQKPMELRLPQRSQFCDRWKCLVSSGRHMGGSSWRRSYSGRKGWPIPDIRRYAVWAGPRGCTSGYCRHCGSRGRYPCSRWEHHGRYVLNCPHRMRYGKQQQHCHSSMPPRRASGSHDSMVTAGNSCKAVGCYPTLIAKPF